MVTEENKDEIVKLRTKMLKHSLLWVWEFSKKAVIIVFIFWLVVQIYSMCVMTISSDYTHLGDLINKAGDIVQYCVFGYLVKAGVENFGKIFFSHSETNEDEPVG